jgi:signal transduction histidine kinase
MISKIVFSQLFQSPRLRLAVLYSSVVGTILLVLGYATHRVLYKTSNQIVDREMDLLSSSMNARLEKQLKIPGVLPKTIEKEIVGICLVNHPCNPNLEDSMLLKLIREDYHLQLLNLQHQPLAAIGEVPGRFPMRFHFTSVDTVKDAQGKPYHLHAILLKTQQGEAWGYLQVGRSVQKFDEYMAGLHWLIVLGVPVTTGVLAAASWWLAGIAMRPIYMSYEKMQRFTADASHELRTPIASTKAMLEVAIASLDLTDPEIHQTFIALQRQNDRLGKLAQDLLLLSQLDLAQKDTVGQPSNRRSPESISLNELIQDLEEELAPIAIAAQVDFTSQIQPQQPLIVHGNPNQLYRLLSNLITNAIQYTAASGSVQIQLSQHQGYAIINVKDNGIGIAKTDLPFLFDRFYRVKHDRSRQTGGVGLGLAIAHAIVQAHGGQIQVQSQLGIGSTFTIRLPLSSYPKSSKNRYRLKLPSSDRPAFKKQTGDLDR